MWDANFGTVRWSTSAGRPAPLTRKSPRAPAGRSLVWTSAATSADRPVWRRWTGAVAAPDVQRSSQIGLCAGPALVHQRRTGGNGVATRVLLAQGLHFLPVELFLLERQDESYICQIHDRAWMAVEDGYTSPMMDSYGWRSGLLKPKAHGTARV
ncbi:hypothetical protein LWI29_013624 [Acer saccharum]|uniref:Uncharacterized protein n=1 Tax=Acer saccharum TaxID=4024 RepID=A0AA39V8T6_ACESA|nr:hypothetical protein LWI29_013624 [Acer saccharum]